ncbi:MAG: 2-amino-4-hydroxy-6-hydroxymethyldihydropteridine diphosphokinase [Novosphingobium sp.]
MQRYLIALGSNVRHHRHGLPPAVLRAALAELARAGVTVERASKVASTRPLGPSHRRYANAAAVIATALAPDALLRRLKAIERQFGRRGGRRWASRVLDLDIVLWEHGAWSSPGLTVPHVAFRHREFVLRPAAAIAPGWRDPLSGRTLRQLRGRLAAGRYTF